MTIVVDANAVALLVPGRPAPAARDWFDRWKAAGEDLHAPQLLTYELASALVQLEGVGQMTAEDGAAVWEVFDTLDVTLHPPSSGPVLVEISRRLRRRSAYDAAYVDLALRLDSELWTLDGKLARNAQSIGLPVRLMV